MEERLRATASLSARTYPNAALTCHEYYPAQAMDLIDEADLVLARHFEFDNAEPAYIRDCDLKYRLGEGAG